MRLSTAPERKDEAGAIAAIHAALDAGATLLDTADAYAHDEGERGHNERLVARALASWSGDRDGVTVATKGGMRRPDGRWVADGRARWLHEACDASVSALGRIDLYQLHAPDPRTAFETSVRALARLHDAGKIRAVGLCNVSVAQIDAARAIVPIAAVQVALSWRDDAALRAGVVRHCLAHGIEVLAHSPLGGWRRRGRMHPTLVELAQVRGVAPELIALGWLLDLGVVPLVGATRIDTARALGAALGIELNAEERARLDEAFPASALARAPMARAPMPRAAQSQPSEVVLIAGIAGAGKSRLAEGYLARGYQRLNRDDAGGTLAELVPELDSGLARGEARWVLDNTYVTRAQRQRVIEVAARHGASVHCLWVDAPLAEAQVNAVRRLVRRYGELPTPERLRTLRKRDPQAFDPSSLFRMHRSVEPPSDDEGFSTIERVAFERAHDADYTGRAVFIQLEGVLRESKSGERAPLLLDDLTVRDDRSEQLRSWLAEGYLLFAFSWQPAVAEGRASESDVRVCFEATRDRLGVPLELSFCPHGDGPPRCWCRPPLPGLLVWRIEQHRLDPAQCLVVGRSQADRTLARVLGMQHLGTE